MEPDFFRRYIGGTIVIHSKRDGRKDKNSCRKHDSRDTTPANLPTTSASDFPGFYEVFDQHHGGDYYQQVWYHRHQTKNYGYQEFPDFV